MDGGRAEAERWLTAAEKLLATRDFHGTKSFAIRARESDPRLEAADRMLAVVDTLLAGECLINGQQPDWYAILQLGHLTQSVELIADHYRRLALLLNPDRNPFPFADQAFRLVSEAWNLLSNPNKKAFYDNELRMIQLGHLGFQQQQQQQPQQPPAPSSAPAPRKSPKSKDPHSAPLPQHEDHRQPPIFNNGAEPSRQPGRVGRPPGSSSSSAAAAAQPTPTELENFWTTCPYCYMLYEYPRVYEDCALKCQGCERAFQAVEVAPPPVTDKDTFYNCWAYFPLGFSGNGKGPDDGPSWKPLSSMFTPPPYKPNKRGPKSTNAAPRVYYDDDDIYVEVSDPSDDSDDADWNTSSTGKKKGRPPKSKSPGNKSVTKNAPADNAGQIPADRSGVGAPENSGVRPPGQPVERAETSRKGPGNPTRKLTGRGAKSLGKLDLNVEFSNEVEEPARAVSEGNGRGHGEEDTIEGTGFFEGLDEFLSSLPILSVVNEDKVKAA